MGVESCFERAGIPNISNLPHIYLYLISIFLVLLIFLLPIEFERKYNMLKVWGDIIVKKFKSKSGLSRDTIASSLVFNNELFRDEDKNKKELHDQLCDQLSRDEVVIRNSKLHIHVLPNFSMLRRLNYKKFSQLPAMEQIVRRINEFYKNENISIVACNKKTSNNILGQQLVKSMKQQPKLQIFEYNKQKDNIAQDTIEMRKYQTLSGLGFLIVEAALISPNRLISLYNFISAKNNVVGIFVMLNCMNLDERLKYFPDAIKQKLLVFAEFNMEYCIGSCGICKKYGEKAPQKKEKLNYEDY